tara:strand:+ start:397 stop:1056 length:660 start_codon:yes stop_codon:yes gene_type:complete
MTHLNELQKITYGLIGLMLLFNFASSIAIYEQEIDDDYGGANVKYYLDEAEINSEEDGKDSLSYSNLGFSEMEDFMTNLGHLTLLLLLASAFLAWKIKEMIDGSDDLEMVQNAGYAVSVLAILSTLYPVYGIPNALEDDWRDGAFDEGDGIIDYDGGFIGEEKINDSEYGKMVIDSGPEMGWYVLVLGGILGILIYNRVKNLEDLGPSRKLPEIPTKLP